MRQTLADAAALDERFFRLFQSVSGDLPVFSRDIEELTYMAGREADELMKKYGRGYSFYKSLGRQLMENCQRGPYSHRRYWLFGETIMHCDSDIRVGIEAILGP